MKDITITLDKNYCIPAAVMLYSLFSKNDPKDIHVHIILNFRNFLYKIPMLYVLKKKKCRYSFYLIQEKDMPFSKDLIINEHITVAAYFRLLLPSILKDLNKVLYLDCDLIVEGNIEELWNTDIDEYTLSAVYYNNAERISSLELKQGYFNSGVMLLNLDTLRKNNYELKFLDFIKKYPDKIKYWDQDVLNVVTEGTVLPLFKKWNFLCVNFDDKTVPTIIHYVGSHKPWNIYYDKLFKDNYYYYLKHDKLLHLLNSIYNIYVFLKIRILKIFK